MYHVTVNPHVPEAGCHGYWLVRNEPHLRSPAIGFHGEPNRSAIQSAHTDAFQHRDDLARDFVGLIGRVMEFEIRDGTGGGTNIFPIHANHEANERFRLWQKPENVSLLIRDFRAVNLHKTRIVGPCFETHLTEPLTIKGLGPGDPVASRLSGVKLLYRRMLCLLCHDYAQVVCIYIYIIQKRFTSRPKPG